MRRDKILIITEKDDIHASELIDFFNSRGMNQKLIRLSIEDFQTNVKAFFDGYGFQIKILDSGRVFSSEEIMSVWFRKPIDTKANLIDDYDGQIFAGKEFKTFINGFYYSLPKSVLWVNGRKESLIACNKLYQLRIAKDVGFNVPPLIITNDSEELLKFMKDNENLCNKCISTSEYRFNNGKYLYCTNIFSKNEIMEYIDDIDVSPTMFQKYIDKELDIRVTVIGDKIFACEIHSQDNSDSKIDFRLVDPLKIAHKVHQMPDEIVRDIKKFMDIMELNFAAMDFVLDTNGKYWFLESNCNGQWLWIEYQTGMKMIEAMADLLLSPEKNSKR